MQTHWPVLWLSGSWKTRAAGMRTKARFWEITPINALASANARSESIVGYSENVPTGLPVSPPRSPVRGGWGANATWYLSTSNSFMTSRRGTRESQPAWLAGLASLASFDHAVCRRRADTKFRSDPTHAPTLRMQPLSVFRARLMSRVKTRLTTEFSGDRMPISPPPTELESHG